MNDARICPHPDCSARIEWDRFACRSHWFALPTRIRNGILSAWRRVLNQRDGATEQLEAAQAEALDHWRVTP